MVVVRALFVCMVVSCIPGWIPALGAAPGLGVASPEGPLADIQRVTPSQAFRLAYQDYLKGHFDLALSEFRQFVADFPQSSLAAKALYYMGECYEQQGNLKEAARTLSILLEDYGTSRQVPAALFKLGKVMQKTGNSHKAKAYWMTLIKNFRGSPEAKLASHRLKRIP